MKGWILGVIATTSVVMITIITTLIFIIVTNSNSFYLPIEITGHVAKDGVGNEVFLDITGGVNIKNIHKPDTDMAVGGDTISVLYQDDETQVSVKSNNSDWQPNKDELEVASYFYSVLKANGFSDASAAGVLGNIQQESSMNAAAVQSNGPGRGLFQYEKGSKRYSNLQKYCEEKGLNDTDYKAQIQYFVEKELTSEDTWIKCLNNCHSTPATVNWCDNYISGFTHPGMTIENFKALSSVEQATVIFQNHFERPGKPAYENRLKYAKGYYAVLEGMEGINVSLTATINFDKIVDIPEKYKNLCNVAYEITFSGTINGYPAITKGAYCLPKTTQGTGVHLAYIDTSGYWGEQTTGTGQLFPDGSGECLWPVGDKSGTITSGFGLRSSPGGIGSTNHAGIDIGVPVGTAIVASNPGTVIKVDAVGASARGIYVKIDHGNGIATLYQHLSEVEVSEGQTVQRGEEIAKSGNTGRSTGPHLHFEVHINGTPVDPLSYLSVNDR